MDYEKIRVNETAEFNCFYVDKNGTSSMTACLATTDYSSIKNAFKNIELVEVFGKDGQLKYSTTKFHKYSDIKMVPEFKMDEETGEWMDCAKIVLEPDDLKGEVERLSEQVVKLENIISAVSLNKK